MKKKTLTRNVLTESPDVELNVTFDYSTERVTEEGHGIHVWHETSIDIKHIELVIAGESLTIKGSSNIFPYLSKKQLIAIEESIAIDS